LADLQRTVYPHTWSPISCRSSAGQGKFAGACTCVTAYLAFLVRITAVRREAVCVFVRYSVYMVGCRHQFRHSIRYEQLTANRKCHTTARCVTCSGLILKVSCLSVCVFASVLAYLSVWPVFDPMIVIVFAGWSCCMLLAI